MKGRFGDILCAVAGFGGFAAASLALHSMLPLPELPEIDVKLKWLAAHPGEFNTLFFGSSRVYHQVIPGIFDAAMASAGHRTKSFNLGVDGMFSPESLFMLERVLERKPSGVKWVFIELTDVETKIDENKKETLRAVYWHDLRRTAIEFQALYDDLRGDSWRRSLRWDKFLRLIPRFWMHLELAAKNYTDLGRGIEIIRSIRSGGQGALFELGPARDGYVPEPQRPPLSGHELSDYQAQLAKMTPEERAKKKPHPELAALLDETTRELARAGAQAVFFTTPTPDPLIHFSGHRGDFSAAPLLAFNDPAAFPDLYKAPNRFDSDHLNTRGAEEFSRMLAAAFAARLGPVK